MACKDYERMENSAEGVRVEGGRGGEIHRQGEKRKRERD